VKGPTSFIWDVRSVLSLSRKSLKFDGALLMIKELSLRSRGSFLVGKYLALSKLALGRQPVVSVGGLQFHVDSLSALGTLHSNIVDFHREFVRTKLLSDSDLRVLDIGANVGQFCLAVRLFFPSAEVVCFEADPNTFEILQRNLANIPGITLNNLAIASKVGESVFFRHSLSVMGSFRPYPDVLYDESHKIRLPTHRLDDVITTDKAFDLVKIDVEGYEFEVIDGGGKVLAASHYLLVEIRLCDSHDNGSNLKIFEVLSARFPESRLIRCGRALGSEGCPISQDMIFQLTRTFGVKSFPSADESDTAN